jgi:hypothetical protein
LLIWFFFFLAPAVGESVVDMSVRLLQFRQPEEVAQMKPPAGQKTSYTTTAVVMAAAVRFPNSNFIRQVCMVPGHEHLNLTDTGKRCGCAVSTFVPRYVLELCVLKWLTCCL